MKESELEGVLASLKVPPDVTVTLEEAETGRFWAVVHRAIGDDACFIGSTVRAEEIEGLIISAEKWKPNDRDARVE